MSDTPGNRLKTERLKRGLSIEDITAKTKMRPSIIKALEADDYTQFPSITHARNFLSLYGKHLAVDVRDGVASLATPAKMGIENYQYLNVERHEDTSYRPQRHRRSPSHSRNGEPAPRNFGLIIGVIAFLFFAVYLIINLQRLNLASSSKPAAKEATSGITTPLEPNPPEPSPKPGKLRAPDPVPDPSNDPFYTPTLDSRSLVRPTPRPRF